MILPRNKVALAAVFALALAPSAGAGLVRWAPDSIPHDGSADATAALNAWVASVPDGSSLGFRAGSIYRLDGTLVLAGRRNLAIDGHGATLKKTATSDNTKPHVLVSDGENVVIAHVVVRGANRANVYNPLLEHQHAFSSAGAAGLTLDAVQAYDVFGDFVYLGRSATTRLPSARIVVRGSRFVRNGRMGLAVVSAEDVVFEGSHVGGVPRYAAFDFEPNSSSCVARRVTVSGNTIGKVANLVYVTGYGPEASDVTVTKNTMTVSTGGYLVWTGSFNGLRWRGPLAFTDNTLRAAGHSGGTFVFSACDGVTVARNQVTFASSYALAVSLDHVHTARVTGNDFAGAAKILTTRACADVQASGNTK